jgi:A nuclease family of the HNH/ENDO VII superfamily with conserved AHH
MLTFREMRRRCKAVGFHCHHIIPIAVVEHRSLARIIGRARFVGFEPQDFASNGMHLPSTEEQAVIFNLPMHSGPHRRYNDIVASRISLWSKLPPEVVLAHMHNLQNSLKRGLRRGPVSITSAAQIGVSLYEDFIKLDAAIESLFEMTKFDV